jgi:energy-converting hydrogenase Eha subunit F
MAERKNRLDDPNEALKAIAGAQTNRAIFALFLAILLLIGLTVLSIHSWLS